MGPRHQEPGFLGSELLPTGLGESQGMFSVVEFPVFSKERVRLNVLQVNEREVNFLRINLILATLLSARRGQAGAGWGGSQTGPGSRPLRVFDLTKRRWVPRTRHATEALGKGGVWSMRVQRWELLGKGRERRSPSATGLAAGAELGVPPQGPSAHDGSRAHVPLLPELASGSAWHSGGGASLQDTPVVVPALADLLCGLGHLPL